MGNTFHDDGRYPIRRHVLTWKQTDPESEQIRFIERWQEGRVTFVGYADNLVSAARPATSVPGGMRLMAGKDSATGVEPHATIPIGLHERLLTAEVPTRPGDQLVAWLRCRARESVALAQHRRGHPHGAGATSEASQARVQPFAAADGPNDVWSIDLKGWFRTGDGVRINPRPCRMPHRGICLPVEDIDPMDRRRAESWSAPFGSMDSTTAHPSLALAWEACRLWRSGGSSWASSPSGSSLATPSRTDGWSGCTGR